MGGFSTDILRLGFGVEACSPEVHALEGCS